MRDRVIVALDVGSAAEALAIARSLEGRCRWLKVGMTLFYAEGPAIVTALRDLGFDVFVDLKIHDIPHQAEGAARSLSALGAGMITVHATGGEAMISAALEGARDGAAKAGVASPRLLAITVLTSTDDTALATLGIPRSVEDQVDLLAGLAKRAGADGVVCSPHEAKRMRSLWGAGALVVTPGVRQRGEAVGDQARVASPGEAVEWGASHIVIGRPITGAADPAAAFEEMVSVMEGSAR